MSSLRPLLGSQGNHYQFDTIRRAKYSSAMIMYHVNNPTAPAFIHTCDSCNHDITRGNRWECEKCTEYDLCDTCKPKVAHPHELKPVPVRRCAPAEGGGGSGRRSCGSFRFGRRHRCCVSRLAFGLFAVQLQRALLLVVMAAVPLQ
jgi:hypothetical protein